VLFTRPALALIVTIAVAGFGVWIALIVGRYGTPFVVAERLVLGGLVFFAGRGLLVVLHELAHGLAMESVGRRVRRAGVKLVFVFPYAFVDTSEVWFEPRRRRAAVSAAGPLSDVTLAGLFSILCLALGPGAIRDVAFQLAFGGYVAAFFNLNPFLERDGYHILADRLGVPGLRARAGGAAPAAVGRGLAGPRSCPHPLRRRGLGMVMCGSWHCHSALIALRADNGAVRAADGRVGGAWHAVGRALRSRPDGSRPTADRPPARRQARAPSEG